MFVYCACFVLYSTCVGWWRNWLQFTDWVCSVSAAVRNWASATRSWRWCWWRNWLQFTDWVCSVSAAVKNWVSATRSWWWCWQRNCCVCTRFSTPQNQTPKILHVSLLHTMCGRGGGGVCVCARMVSVCPQTHTHACTHIHMRVRTYAHACTHTHTCSTRIYIYRYYFSGCGRKSGLMKTEQTYSGLAKFANGLFRLDQILILIILS